MAKPPKTSQIPPVPVPESQQGPPSASPPKKKADLDSHVSGALDSIPEPSEAAIAAQQARMQAELEGAEDETAKKGKRGPYKTREKGKSTVVKPGESRADKVKVFRKIGYEMADLILTVGLTIGGEDWKPAPPVMDQAGNILYDERSNLREAWADFAEEHEWEKFPAWLGVTLATATYVGPRLTAPSTQVRVSKFKLWWDARKMKKQELEDIRNREKAKAAEEARKKADAA